MVTVSGLAAAAAAVAGGAAAIGGVFTGLMVREAFRSRLVPLDLAFESLPEPFDGYRILFVSDIHRRRLPEDVLAPLKGQVDAVFAGGDMTEKDCPLPRLEDNMALLRSIAPVYAVHGNHDYRADIARVDDIIRRSGAVLLQDENVPLYRGGGQIWLTGVDYPRRGGKTAYNALPPLPSGEAAFRIIMVHDPIWLTQRITVPGDLVLAGHTHGGQVVLPLLGTKKVESFYYTYRAGLYDWPRGDGTSRPAKLFISRGFGTAHLPIRWGSPAEMNVITLRRSNRAR